MMRPLCPVSHSLASFFSLLLSYLMAVSLFAPFAIKRVEAAPVSGTTAGSTSKKAPEPIAARAQEPQSRWRGGEILVRFREHAPITKMNALLRANGAQWSGRLRGQSDIERLRLSEGADPETVATRLRSSEFVEFAEPNYLITADQSSSQNTPDDARYSEQWALLHTGSTQGWALTTGAKQTVIAVIDSGIDFSHPDLINNQWDNALEQPNNRDNDGNGFNSDLHGWDFVTNSSGIVDERGHGTAVAGIIAAQGNNRVGITGVMWRAGLMSLRVLDGNGKGDIATAVEAIDYATANGAQVINCSWGTDDASHALREAINRAAQHGVVVVTAAGNSSRDLETTAHYPASYDLPNLIAVAATDNADSLTPSSNWGAMHVSIAAPGAEILTTQMGGKYQTVSGTSASAPFVTGVAGLIKTLRPWLSSERTREMILRGARQIPSLSDKVAAKGVISAAGAAEVLNTLPQNEGTEESGEINGGERGNTEDGRRRPRDNRPGRGHRNNDRNRDGREFSVTPPARMRGAPGAGLPNLDEMRNRQPTNPRMPAPIPSNRCSHNDPGCASRKRQAAIESPTDLLAWGLNLPHVASVLEDNSRPVSDSPFQLFWAPLASLSAPAPLPQTTRTNFALASNGSAAMASSVYLGYPLYASAAINGDRKGLNYPNDGSAWQDEPPAYSSPDWLQIDFNSNRTIDEIDVITLQDNYASPIEPTQTTAFTKYGLTGFDVQYWDGSAWTTVPGGSVTGNHNVWKQFTFSPITTTMIRVLANASGDGYSRITELEAWGTAPPRANVALSSNGGTATASSTYLDPAYGYTPGAANNNERKGVPSSSNFWLDAAPANTFPDWLQVDFNGTKIIDEVDVFTLQDNYSNPIEPSETTTFSLYGLTGFDVQYWNGSSWVTVPGGSVTGNNKVWRKFTFPAIATSKIRVLTNASPDGYSRITEVEAWGTSASGPASNSFSMERLDPKNRTGGGDVDLLSRNANWSLPILGLKGRAGLDLELSLSYNSLVWTKSQDGTAIKFDADQGTPSPGFRLGFPVIQQRYYNSQVGVNAYLLITPSGAHGELRQVGASNVYESADSSYLQLIDNGGTLTLRPTDGSQLTYNLKGDQYQCTEIKDRNGNFITVEYYSDGRINTITDTLARVITFVYDQYSNLKEITQDWNGAIHKWATFGWGNHTIQTGFSGLTIIGPQNGTIIPVLTQVGFADGTRYNFEYNSYAQVFKVRHYAEDNHQLSYTSYTLPVSSSECPRVTEGKVWAENWNNHLEATTLYSTASDYSSGQATMPDGTIYKELFAITNNWQRGLTIGTEYWADLAQNGAGGWSGLVKKKWTTTAYTQDDTNLGYEKNPRVIETNVFDSDNKHKRTTINYDLYASYGLPHYVDEYDADGVTLLRRTSTDYNLSQAYLDRRIIGLVSAVHMSDGTGWQSKTVYYYDAGGDQLQATTTATTQHDASYGTSFTVGRGNLTAIARFDVTDANNDSKRLITYAGYDTNGSVIFTRDQLNHQTSMVSYADSFSDGVNRNTFAYPTSITDADNNSSTIKYNYSFGATTRTEGPPPAGYTQGAIRTFEYDAAGRTTRANNLVNGAYQRWVYGSDAAVGSFTTIQAGAPEAYSVTYWDGAGRVIAQGGDNPNSVGLYLGQYIRYDIMGRSAQVSNAIEMNASWIPTGDDAAGWVWTLQAYDWKGRPTVTTNPDGTTKETTYGGCGCAGGEVVTSRDEVGRSQRTTADVLGRLVKTEVLNWNGTTVYSTTTNIYNARDQITSVSEQGSSGAGQTTTLAYDGYGRLLTRQAPSQTSATTYAYNLDDTVQSVTDARGVVSGFTYNNRHLVTGISYSKPTGVAATGAVTFTYDAAGNRTSMTDGSGSVSYVYDQLSRLTSESKQFSDLPGITRTLSYQYNLASQLTSITDPFGAVINYAYDKTGRMTNIAGSAFAGVTQYASNMEYMAWGATKSASYGDNTALSVSYNSRLQPTDMSVTNQIAKHYEYNADGRLRFTQDLLLTNSKFDRSYAYDHVGRVTQALSGAEARQQGTMDDRPYNLTYTYDELNHLTSRTGSFWEAPLSTNVGSGVYDNDKNTGWQYDADGRLTDTSETQYTYDASGSAIGVVRPDLDVTLSQTQVFDGDGTRTKLVSRQEVYHQANNTTTTDTKTQYFVTSSVIDAVVTELDQNGAKTNTFVYQGSEILAWQQKGGTTESVAWEHRDPSSATVRGSMGGAELEPMGSNAGLFKGFAMPPPPSRATLEAELNYPFFSSMGSGLCTVDRIESPCYMFGLDAVTTRAVNQPNPKPKPPKPVSPTPGLNPFAGPTMTQPYGNRAFARYGTGVIEFSSTPGQFAGLSVRSAADGYGSTLPPLQVNRLLSDVTWLLEKETCNKFVTGVLASLNQSVTAPHENTLDLFAVAETILGEGGFRRGYIERRAALTVTSNYADGSVFRLIGIDPASPTFANLNGLRPFEVSGRGVTIIHELIHGAGRGAFGHDVMAEAARIVALSLEFTRVGELPVRRNFPEGNIGSSAFDDANSRYFQDQLIWACFRSK